MANSQTFTINIKALFNAEDVKSKIQGIQSSLKNLRLPDNLNKSFTQSFNNVNKALDDYISKTSQEVKTKADATGISKSLDKVIVELTKFDSEVGKIQTELGNSVDLSKIIKLDGSEITKLNEYKNEIKGLSEELKKIPNDANKITELEKKLTSIKKGTAGAKHAEEAIDLFKKGEIEEAIKLLDKYIAKYSSMNLPGAAGKTVENTLTQFNAIRDVFVQAQEEASNLTSQINETSSKAAAIVSNKAQEINGSLSGGRDSFQAAGEAAGQAAPRIREMAEEQANFNREVDQIKSRIQYFFGLNNAINLFRRTVQNAVQTVKELDATMTETAVVTDFSVSDMWGQLPEYTKRANELGVSTQQAYEAATLYYQQGLNTNEVNALSVETLKMARIAGLDAAEATDRMTNALRGFNMALDETNARRVNDVYSELAARTASDVDEISTAMTKVASLANSANMEFETTSAFLTQIIETTREAPETAGTALKTIIARFTEVKKLFDEGQLKGTDEEGIGIDLNKISSALRIAGIDLNKYFLGEMGLDDVFMELASKWDGLTNIQQRYIATQAAGSRQQSRFIAMMQDYARTQELVSYAYNANGASAKQFEKTQDSLQSKLAKLKNAWNEFAMSIANSNLIKGVVDALTLLLNVVNKITSGFGAFESGAGAAVNAILKLGMAAATLKLGGLFLGTGAGAIGGLISGKPISLKDAFINSAYSTLGAGAVKLGEKGAIEGLNQSISKTLGMAAMGPFRQMTPLGEKIKQFKQDNPTSPWMLSELRQKEYEAKQAYLLQRQTNPQDLEAVKAKRQAYALAKNNLKQAGGAPKSLFEALGNKFVNTTKLGGSLSKGLGAAIGKIGIGGGAALGGAATLAATLGTVAVAAGAAYVAIKLIYDASPAGQLKSAQKLADTMQEVASSASQAAEATKTAQETYSSKTSDISNARTISERNTAIQNRNDYITSLLEQDAAYAEYLSSTFENGQLVLTLDENALADAANKAAESATSAAIASDFANAMVAGRQANVYRSNAEAIKQGYYSEELTSKQKASIARYENLAAQEDIKMQALATQAFSKQIARDFEGVDDEVANTVAEALGKTFTDKDYADLLNNQKNHLRENGQTIRQQYENLFGKVPEGLKRSDMKDAIKEYYAEQEKSDTTAELMELVQKDTRYKNILEAYNGNGKLNNIALENIDLTTDDIFTALNIDTTSEEFKKLAKALNLEIDQLKEQIKATTQTTKDLQKANKAKVFQKMSEAGLNIDKAIQETINDMSPEQIASAANIAEDAQKSLSTLDFQSLLQQLPNFATDQLSELETFFGEINLDNPIKSFEILNDAINDVNSSTAEWASKILEANADLFDTGNLFQTFVTSADFDELTESLSDFITENGKITSNNVEQLASECSSLNTILQKDKISVTGLAKALTALQQGNAPIEGLTTRVLEALSVTENFGDMIDEISDIISNFDPGTDFGEGVDFVVDQTKKLSELVDSFEFGNEQTANIYNQLFGEDAYQTFMSKWGNKGIEEYAGEAKNRITQLAQWAENNSYGFMRDFTNQLGIQANGEFDFIWDTQGRTTVQLTQEVADAAQVSMDTAKMLIEGWAAQSYDFVSGLNENDYQAIIKTFAADISGARAITEQELQVIASSYNKAVDEIKADLAILDQQSDITIPVIVSWQDSNGQNLSGEELVHQFIRTFGSPKDDGSAIINWSNYLQDVINKATGNVDADALMSKLSESGLNDSQATEMADHMVSKINGNFTKTIQVPIAIKLEEGSLEITQKDVPIAADSMAGLQQLEDAALEAAKYEIIGQKVADSDISGLQTNLDNLFATVAVSGKAKIEDSLNTTNTSNLQAKIDNAISSGGVNAISNIQSLLSSTTFTGRVTLTTSGAGTGATGGIVGSAASGAHILKPGKALTGEEGEEIVWNKEKGYSYITGSNGPEFQNLQPGDRIFNAVETRKILKNSSFAKGGLYGSYRSGGYNRKNVGDNGSGGSGSGSGSGVDEDIEEIKNELDWLYNLVQDIKELEKQEELLQEQYEFLLKDQNATGHDLYNVMVQQMGNLTSQLAAQQLMLEKRQQEMREFMAQTNDVEGYARWNEERNEVEIDWGKIDKDIADSIIDKDQYDHIVDIIDELETIEDNQDDAEKAYYDTLSKIQEFQSIWRDTYIDFEKRIYDAIVKTQQKIIDGYSELNDTLNNSNQSILDSLQKEINLQRQIRDNTKTEEEIADSEAQLAYLRRDTTGGNDIAIKQLEKELGDQRQSYEDNLIDQAIDRISEDNDKAAEQREHQIEIMQAQLDYVSENGLYWEEVTGIINDAIDEDGALKANSQLIELLSEIETNGMSETGRREWDEELANTFKEVVAWEDLLEAIENNSFTSAFSAAMTPLTELLSDYSQSASKIYQSSSGSGGGGGGSSGGGSGYVYYPPSNTTTTKDGWYDVGSGYIQEFNNGTPVGRSQQGTVVNGEGYLFKSGKLVKASTGGLFTTTGLMQIDGTADKPEYVLNADQTKAFLKLTEVLPTIMSGSTQTSTSANTIYLNLTMNVDEIGSDYDVDRIADRVKDIIYDTSTYRTVNTLNFSR